MKHSYRAVLKGVLSQLVVQERDLLPHFRRRQEASSEPVLSATKVCETLLETALRNQTERSFIVIDGLDEFGDKHDALIDLVKRIIDNNKHVKICVLCL